MSKHTREELVKWLRGEWVAGGSNERNDKLNAAAALLESDAVAMEAVERALPLSVFEDIRHRDPERYWSLADATEQLRAALASGRGEG